MNSFTECTNITDPLYARENMTMELINGDTDYGFVANAT